MKLTIAILSSLPAIICAQTYQNPIISGFAPDPSICRVGSDFYLVNSSFTMFPALPVYQSKDLINWKLVGHAASTAAQVPLLGGDFNSGIWAPTIRHHNGKFYVIVKNQTANEIILTSTSDPSDQWSEKIVVGGKGWSEGIDPDLFFDADGTCYVTKPTWKDGRARFHAWKLDVKTGSVSDPRELWRGEGRNYEEGPHLFRKGEYYYLLLAEGGTGDQHCVTIARRPVALGLGSRPEDWEPCPTNPILFNDPAKAPEVHATGHADLVEDSLGNWWMVHLGIRKDPSPNLGRETFLTPVQWKDDWPLVNGGKPITRSMNADGLPASHPWPKPAIRDDFNTSTLDLEWNFFRNPNPESWSLTSNPGALTLNSTGEQLAGTGKVAWLGRRLRSKECRFASEASISPVDDQAAGISLFSRQDAYVELVVTSSPSGREALLRRKADGVIKHLAALPLPATSPACLEFIVQERKLYSRISTDHGNTWQTIHQEWIDNLVPYPGFAGLYFGIQATGSGATASFDWAEYENLPNPLQIDDVTGSLRELTIDEQSGSSMTTAMDGRIEVELGVMDGPRVEASTVGFIENGGTISLSRIKNAERANFVTARIAAMNSGGEIEIHVDTPTGPVIATLTIPSTGGWQSWKEITAPITPLSPGTRDLAIVFRGGNGYLMNLDWIRFDSTHE